MKLSDEARDQLGRIAYEAAQAYLADWYGPDHCWRKPWNDLAQREPGYFSAIADSVAAAMEARYADLVDAVRAMVEQTKADGRLSIRDRQCFEWPCGYAAVEAALDALAGVTDRHEDTNCQNSSDVHA